MYSPRFFNNGNTVDCYSKYDTITMLKRILDKYTRDDRQWVFVESFRINIYFIVVLNSGGVMFVD